MVKRFYPVDYLRYVRSRARGQRRAIALCGNWTGLAEEQAQPVIIVESGAESATADAVARRAIVAQHVQRHATDQGQVFGGMVLAGLASILAELHVQDPVLLVFDAQWPRTMAANRSRSGNERRK